MDTLCYEEKKKEEKSSTNSSDKSGRKWHLMNVIIVSFPLVFHIINLPECSCISVWALTKSIQTLCCAVTQIAQAHTHTHAHTRTYTHTHLHNTTPRLSVIYYGSDNHNQHTTAQSHANYTSIHCQRLWWIPSLSFFRCPPLSLLFSHNAPRSLSAANDLQAIRCPHGAISHPCWKI